MTGQRITHPFSAASCLVRAGAANALLRGPLLLRQGPSDPLAVYPDAEHSTTQPNPRRTA